LKVGGIVAIAAGSALLFGFASISSAQAPPQVSPGTVTPSSGTWKFAVSGDSRNCGDVVMPGIEAAVQESGASFYWHLGDFRKMSEVDEDIAEQPQYAKRPLSIPAYRAMAWNDFVVNQLDPFGSFPVYLSRGNHELGGPNPDGRYIAQFTPWIDRPNIRTQRLRDDADDAAPHIYYHWIQSGVDFISFDNGTSNFDDKQVKWFEKVLSSDASNSEVFTIVAGMHEALPESISKGHSMNQTEPGTESGRRVYLDLLKAQNEAHKNVYVLASHSHYFMDGIFKTPYWRANGGVLPGWIVGTAGAVRYALPPEARDANAAKTNVYGFLLASVDASGKIRFDFQELTEKDVPPAVRARYTPKFIHWCFAENSQKPGADH